MGRGPWVLRLDCAPHTLHTIFLHAASGPQMTACTGESLLCLLLAFEARSGADPSSPHTLLCRHTLSCLLLSSCSSFSQDSETFLWAAVLESGVLLPLSRLLAAPTTADLLSGPAMGLPAVLGPRFMVLPLFTFFSHPEDNLSLSPYPFNSILHSSSILTFIFP